MLQPSKTLYHIIKLNAQLKREVTRQIHRTRHAMEGGLMTKLRSIGRNVKESVRKTNVLTDKAR